MTLGQYISKYREEHGYSQRQFANVCGLSNGYIAMLERGTNPNTGEAITPTLPTLNKLARAMGTTVDVLAVQLDDVTIDLTDTSPEADGGFNIQLFAAGVGEDNIDDIFMELASRLDRQALLDLAQKLIALASTK